MIRRQQQGAKWWTGQKWTLGLKWEGEKELGQEPEKRFVIKNGTTFPEMDPNLGKPKLSHSLTKITLKAVYTI